MTLIVCDDDTLIRTMLINHGITEQPPNPPNDISICTVDDGKCFWVVIHFWQEGDNGFCAYGIPNPSSQEERFIHAKRMIESVTDASSKLGIEAWKHAEVIPISSPHEN